MPTGREIMVRAGRLLGDETFVRWTLPELCDWINEAVRAIILAKPSARSETRALNLVEGTRQSVPSAPAPTPLALIGIVCNLTSASPRIPGRAIRATTRAQLDAHEPNWHNPGIVRYQREVRQFVFDELNPLEFYVYPGNTGTGAIEAVLSILPAPLKAAGAADQLASYAGEVGLPEPYSGPILDYALYRAQTKDDTTGNAGRAAAHFAQFATAIGLKIQTEGAHSPNRR